MSTLAQLIYKVRNGNMKGRGNRAQTFTDRLIASWINDARVYVLYAELIKEKYVPVSYEQDLGCVTLETVDQADCANFNWGNLVKKVVIPKPIKLPDNGGISFFGKIDKRTTIYLPDENYGALDDEMPFQPKKDLQAKQIGNTIYIYGDDIEKLCVVNVRGVFEDPTLVQTCGATGMEPKCFDPDVDCYPLPTHLEGIVLKFIDDTYIFPKVNLPADNSNNEKDEAAM